MANFVSNLDQRTQLLIALGSSIAAGCQPCLETIVGQARAAGIAEDELQSAAIIGQFVKDQPAEDMKQLADELLGTHLAAQGATPACPLDDSTTADSARHHGSESGDGAGRGCGCR